MKRSALVIGGVVAVLVLALAAVLLLVFPQGQHVSTTTTPDLAPAPAQETQAAPSSATPDAAPRIAVVAGPKGINRLAAPDGASIEAVTGPDGVPVVRLSGVDPVSSPGGRPGIYLPIPVPFEQAASGRTVRVDVIARSAASNPSPAFAVSYSTADVGNSGWKPFALTDKLTRYSFTYDVPQMKKGQGDFIGFLAHPADAQGAVEISEISAEVLPAGTATQP